MIVSLTLTQSDEKELLTLSRQLFEDSKFLCRLRAISFVLCSRHLMCIVDDGLNSTMPAEMS